MLDKIKKLMALSESSNEHEAALALQKAQELMAAHNVTMADISLADFIEGSTKSAFSVSKLKPFETVLMQTIGGAFTCKVFVTQNWSRFEDNWLRWKFVGRKDNVELAVYTATVMVRKLAKARADFVSTLPSIAPRAWKTAQADGFCMGWVAAVRKPIRIMAIGEEEAKLIEAYEKAKMQIDEKKVESQKRQLGAWGYEKGQEAGARESLHRPMGEADQRKMIR